MSGQNGQVTRADLLAPRKLPVLRVEVPAWQEAVFVRTITAKEAQAVSKFSDGNYLGRWLALVLSDADGDRILSDEDAETILQHPLSVLQPIAEAAMEHNGMGDAETASKNLPTIRPAS